MSTSAAIADPLLRRAFGWQGRHSVPRRTVQVRLDPSRLRMPVSQRDCAISRRTVMNMWVEPVRRSLPVCAVAVMISPTLPSTGARGANRLPFREAHETLNEMVSHTYHELHSRLKIALACNALIILAEFVGGFLTNSIGLIGDAGHNLVDQGSLFLALYAHILTARPATDARTFGYHRAGIVAAFLNSFILILTAVGITLVSVQRLMTPVQIPGGWVMLIALVSFAANLSIALLLQHGAKDDLNIRSAFWHMLSDAWVSLGVVVSGGIILLTGWSILDPLISLFVVVAIARGAWPLFKESLEVLLESTPPGVSPAQVAASIESIPGVKNVHDLHIWAVEPRLIMMTTHVQVDGDDQALTTDLLQAIRTRITTQFSIKHVTIQLETECCHPEAVHCDLNRLAGQHAPQEILHSHQ